MLLSQTAQYAVRAAIHLAQSGGDAPLPVSVIAEALDVPRNYLSKILHQLARAGVLASERGPHGGFRLAAPPGELSIADIVDAVEPLRPDPRCLLGRQRCSDDDPCPAHDRWRALADGIDAFLVQTTLSQLASARAGPKPRRARRRSTGSS